MHITHITYDIYEKRGSRRKLRRAILKWIPVILTAIFFAGMIYCLAYAYFHMDDPRVIHWVQNTILLAILYMAVKWFKWTMLCLGKRPL